MLNFLKRLPRTIGDSMYDYDDILSSSPIDLPPMRARIGEEDFDIDLDHEDPNGPRVMGRKRSNRPSGLARGLRAAGGMLQGGIDAAATPNIAGGGATDFFRAMQNSGDARRDRQMQDFAMDRQRRQDQMNAEMFPVELAHKQAQARFQAEVRPDQVYGNLGLGQGRLEEANRAAQQREQFAKDDQQRKVERDEVMRLAAERDDATKKAIAAFAQRIGAFKPVGAVDPNSVGTVDKPGDLKALPQAQLGAVAQSQIKKNEAQADKAARPPVAGKSGEPSQDDAIVAAVVAGAVRLEDIVPTVRTRITPKLHAAGFMSGPKLSPGQQDDLSTMDTNEKLIDEIMKYASDGKIEGVGFGTGPAGQLGTKILGTGSEEAKDVRQLIGNVRGAIVKLRAGTAMTPQEQKLVDTYTPTINESQESVISKLSGLKKFIAIKRESTMKFSGRGAGANAPVTETAGVKVQRNKNTGAVRHSVDGGKTWRSGPPAQ